MPSWGRFLVFALVLGVLSALLHYYVWARVIRDAALPLPWSRIATSVLIGFAIALPLSMPFARLLPRAAAVPVATVIYTWLGLLFLLFIGVLVGDLVRLVIVGGDRLADFFRESPRQIDPARRAALGRLVAAVVGIGAVGAAVFGVASARGPIATRKVKVALKRLPASMAGFTIAQLTDVHVGPTIGHDFLADVVKRVNALNPDAVVITGDLVDGSVDDLREHVAPLGELRAKHGVFFVTGNHEYYSGADAWIAELTRLGVRVLRNERVELRVGDDVIDLAGIDDFSAHQFGHGADLPRALSGRDPSRELVLLAHQPRAIVEAAKLGVGLQLSGHTHGGQIWPWNYLVYLQQPYVAGLHRHGDAQIYVSRGTGYWGPPMRVGAPAEITQIELSPA